MAEQTTRPAPVSSAAEVSDPGPCGPNVGDRACEIVGEHVGGKGPATLDAARGKVIIVDFWATFCTPCTKSHPAYQRLLDEHPGKLAVIAVSVDDANDTTPADLNAFARGVATRFPIVWDKSQSTIEKYQPAKLPSAYVVDREGVIRHIHGGFSPSDIAKLQAEVEALLAKK